MPVVREVLRPFKDVLARTARKVGYDRRNWLRIRQIEAFTAFLSEDSRNKSAVLEVSPGWNKCWKALCTDYTSVDYPDFDICKDKLDRKFRIVIVDQVLEHVRRPIEASKNIFAMTEPVGGRWWRPPSCFGSTPCQTTSVGGRPRA